MHLRMRELEEGTSLREIDIAVIVGALLKGLKSVMKGVGNGSKTLGSKIAATLLGLFGSIVCFIFKTAGSVISLIRQNAWLLLM